MIANRRDLALQAAAKALWVRRQLRIALDEPLSPFDAAERLGIEVRLVDLPSMEGMYVAGEAPKIVLSTLRPHGRRNFTCAHEIGHHAFGHGEQFDEMTDDKTWVRKNDPVEFLANCFASYFLMPKTTVDRSMGRRGWRYDSLSATQAYTLSSWLGASYRALIQHLRYGLGVISHEQSQRLATEELLDVRRMLTGSTISKPLHVADAFWSGRAVDCEVDDLILTPTGTVCEGRHVEVLRALEQGMLWRAALPGISRFSNPGLSWSAFTRVSRSKYVGRSCFRYEEEVEE